VHLNLHHIVSTKLQFVENIADNTEHGTGFRGNIAKYLQPGRKISCDQPGKERVVLVQYYLAKRCLRRRNCPGLESG